MKYVLFSKKPNVFNPFKSIQTAISCKLLIFIATCILFFIFVNNTFAIVYVDPNGDGSGGPSWGQAYNTLADAIDLEGSGETFWVAAVAEGAYQPSAILSPESNSSFYGGFAGTETDLNQRNISQNQTIIDGQNSLKHVFHISNPGIKIDGFTIQNGAATGSGYDMYGGGILVVSQSVIIKNSTFTGNVSNTIGGAVFIDYGSATIEDSIFQNNSSKEGGAVGSNESDLTVTDCTFDSNYANQGIQSAQWGGAVYARYGTPEISGSSFTNNTAGWIGGAVVFITPENGLISNCDFQQNSVTTVDGDTGGGGFAAMWHSLSPPETHEEPSITIEDCLFSQNSSTLEGGGIYSYYCTLAIENTKFQGNTAVNGGALMLDYPLSNPSTIRRCLFVGNSATTGSGGIHTYERSLDIQNSVFAFNSSPYGGAVWLHAGNNSSFNAIFKNCTFSENSANAVNGLGGAVFTTSVPTTLLYNCIFWNNHANSSPYGTEAKDLYFTNTTTSLTIRYTDMETPLGGYFGTVTMVDSTGSFSSDPLFVDPNGEDDENGTLDDNFELSSNSPCLDRADGGNAPNQDFFYRSRTDLKKIPNLGTGSPDYADIGAYEALMASPMAPVYKLLLLIGTE